MNRRSGWSINATLALLALLGSGCTYITRDSAPATAASSSCVPDLSADGRFTVFQSDAQLSPADTDFENDVYRRDHVEDVTELISQSSTGNVADARAEDPAVDLSGNRVVFASEASNLIPSDTNGVLDVFVRRVDTGTTTRVSVASDGTQGNGSSWWPDIATDGAVVFQSQASNLVSGDTNGSLDVFLRRSFGPLDSITQRVSVASDGTQGNAASGRPTVARYTALGGFAQYRVAFGSAASNLVAGDTNARNDIFVHDTGTGITTRVSRSSGGVQANGHSRNADVVTAAGVTLVAFTSAATNLVPGDSNGVDDIFVHNLSTGVTERVSTSTTGAQANGASDSARLSADGRYVTFESDASNLVAGDTNGASDVFVKDRTTGRLWRVSVDTLLAEADGNSFLPEISADGRYVAFCSQATNLVANDTSANTDVFTVLIARPEIAAVVPSTIGAGTTETISIDGDGFTPDSFVRSGSSELTIGAVTFVSETTLEAEVTVAPAAVAGFRNLRVHVPGAGFDPIDQALASCDDCLFITN